MSKYKISFILFLSILILLISGCDFSSGPQKPRLSLFVGVDISGSFVKGGYFRDSIDFLAHYIYCHLNGLGGLEVPNVLFVSWIGGAKVDEAKTFHPITTFEHKTVEEIKRELYKIFPTRVQNRYTDFNAFFENVALTVKNHNLILRPISIIMLSDGQPDIKKQGKTDFKSIVLKPLERLSRNVAIRLLYTDAVTGNNWQTEVRRRKIKIWTQDAIVMKKWKDENILLPDRDIREQKRFFAWIEDNVDYNVRARVVN
jgi:hypothetical protein